MDGIDAQEPELASIRNFWRDSRHDCADSVHTASIFGVAAARNFAGTGGDIFIAGGLDVFSEHSRVAICFGSVVSDDRVVPAYGNVLQAAADMGAVASGGCSVLWIRDMAFSTAILAGQGRAVERPRAGEAKANELSLKRVLRVLVGGSVANRARFC